MSNATPPPGPGLPNQAGARTAFRVLGVLLVGAGLVCVVVAGIDFFRAAAAFGEPTKFWLFFVGLPLLAVGGGLMQAGYAGVAARYMSGEYAPVVKGSDSCGTSMA